MSLFVTQRESLTNATPMATHTAATEAANTAAAG
jgi:hypothetical protein